MTISTAGRIAPRRDAKGAEHRADADTLYSELEGYRTIFRANRERADRIAAALSSDEFNWRPAADRWSVAQCLAHLNVSGELYAARVEEAIRQAREDGRVGTGPFRYGALSRWMLRMEDPSNEQRHKAPAKFVPPAHDAFDVREVLGAFHALGRRWESSLRDADGLDLARVKVRSPALPLLRFSLGAVFAIEAAHEQRHLLQSERVLVLLRCCGG